MTDVRAIVVPPNTWTRLDDGIELLHTAPHNLTVEIDGAGEIHVYLTDMFAYKDGSRDDL